MAKSKNKHSSKQPYNDLLLTVLSSDFEQIKRNIYHIKNLVIERVDIALSEWLLFNANQMSNCSAISWHEQVIFDEMIMMSALY